MRKDSPKKLPKRLPDPKPRPEDTAKTGPAPDRRAAIAATKAKHRKQAATVSARRVAVEVFRERFDPLVMEIVPGQGGKGRQAPKIASEINKRREEGQIYLEPFCGGGAVLCKVDDRGPRAASDTFAPIIDLMEALQEGEMPPKFVSRRAHNQARAYLCELLGAKTYAEAIRRSDTLKQGDLPVSYIWAVLAGSFDGVWMDSYAKKTTKGVIPSTERYNILRDRLKEMPGGIENVEFFHRDYRDWLPHNPLCQRR